MKNKHQFIIVGGGMAADAAVDGIRETDMDASLLMISEESFLPYNRPPLSKALWKDAGMEKIWRQTDQKKIEILLNTCVISINPEKKTIKTDKDQEFLFEKLLLATGGKPRKLPFGDGNILYYRNLEDYQKLRKIADEKKQIAVIGGGFIGSELAAALAGHGNEVTLFDVGAGIGGNLFPQDMIEFLNAYYLQKGVQIAAHAQVIDVLRENDSYRLLLKTGKEYYSDAVVAGIGLLPETELAKQAQLKISDGIDVDEFLQTSFPDIYAAGDNANFYNPTLQRRIRVEHADNANAMGRTAGRNMAGDKQKYDYLPFFYSDLFELGYEAVGLLNNQFEIIEDWQTKHEKGVLYYLQNDQLVGVLLWNVWDKIEHAREMIMQNKVNDPKQLIGKIK